MRKILFTTVTALLFGVSVYAQDVITKRNGDEIMARVLEITQNEIKYKKFDNQTGPTFTLSISDIFMIRYENGTKDVFGTATATQKPVSQNQNYDRNVTTNQNAQVAYKPNFFNMSDREQAQFLEINDPELYRKFHSGMVLRGVGKGLSIPGWILFGLGGVATIVGIVDEDEELIVNGATVIGGGFGFLIPSWIFSGIGNGLKNSAREEYRYRYLGENHKGYFKINLYGNAVGLAYVF